MSLFGPIAEPPKTLVAAQLEQAFLGMLVMRPAMLEHVPSDFKAEFMAVESHDIIFEAIQEIGSQSGPIMLEVVSKIGNTQDNRTYVVGLTSAVVGITKDQVRSYAALLTRLAVRRSLVEVGKQLAEEAAADDRDMDPDTLIAEVQTTCELLSRRVTMRESGPVSLNEAMDRAMDKAEAAAKAEGMTGISVGMQTVDKKVGGGLQPDTLTILGGRPGMGKSALGFQWAVSRALDAKKEIEAGLPPAGVLVLSLEMGAGQLGARCLAAAARIPVTSLNDGTAWAKHENALMTARKRLWGCPLTIEDEPAQTVSQMMLKARAAKRRHGLSLIVIDHMHIARPEERDLRNGGNFAIGQISQGLKRLSKIFHVPVVALAQLSRGVEGREDKRPTLTDLRMSGDIEQDADVIAFVYRGEYYIGTEPPKPIGGKAKSDEEQVKADNAWYALRDSLKGKAELIFAKNRDGPPGTVPLLFAAETTSFREPQPEADPTPRTVQEELSM